MFAQKSYNAFIGLGSRPQPDRFGGVVPFNVATGCRIASLPNKYELMAFGVVESDFRSYNNIGLGFKALFFKKHLPKTFNFFFG